jgi:hypothetical protein
MQSIKEIKKRIFGELERIDTKISILKMERQDRADLLKYLEACEPHEGEIQMKGKINGIDLKRSARVLLDDEKDCKPEIIDVSNPLRHATVKERILDVLGKLQEGHSMRSGEIAKRMGADVRNINVELSNLHKANKIKKIKISYGKVLYSLPKNGSV